MPVSVAALLTGNWCAYYSKRCVGPALARGWLHRCQPLFLCDAPTLLMWCMWFIDIFTWCIDANCICRSLLPCNGIQVMQQPIAGYASVYMLHNRYMLHNMLHASQSLRASQSLYAPLHATRFTTCYILHNRYLLHYMLHASQLLHASQSLHASLHATSFTIAICSTTCYTLHYMLHASQSRHAPQHATCFTTAACFTIVTCFTIAYMCRAVVALKLTVYIACLSGPSAASGRCAAVGGANGGA
eukprot:1161190-Pelagomonas_calceolata.AAC.7